MTALVGVIGAAVLFGLFSMLRQNDKGCTGQCIGCTRDGACESTDERARREEARSFE